MKTLLRCLFVFALVGLAPLRSAAQPSVIAGPISHNGHDYYLLDQSSWSDAESEAQVLGGHLVTINDSDEDAWVYDTFANYGETSRNLWIGFNDVDDEGNFLWTSGESVSYTNWNSDEPNDSGGGEDYGMIWSFTDAWNDLPNDGWTVYGVVEVSSGGGGDLPAVLTGPISHNGHTYYLLDQSSWSDAEAKAQELGGHLVTINDSSEDAWVYDTFSTYGSTDRNLWIGYTDQSDEGTFSWIDGDTSTYTNWASGEPNNDWDAGEDYAMIWSPSGQHPGQWNDMDDPADHDSPVPNGVVEIVDDVPNLPEVISTAQYYNGHTYYLLDTSSWSDAEAKAVSMGGHLVTINDSSEDAWVYDTFSTYGSTDRNLWTGYTDQSDEGNFSWISGDTSTYSNWASGEPNNDWTTGEDYGMIWSPSGQHPGQWNDMDDPADHDSPVPNGVVEID
jgi:hypothetical protein